jgi:hypothetical protein
MSPPPISLPAPPSSRAVSTPSPLLLPFSGRRPRCGSARARPRRGPPCAAWRRARTAPPMASLARRGSPSPAPPPSGSAPPWPTGARPWRSRSVPLPQHGGPALPAACLLRLGPAPCTARPPALPGAASGPLARMPSRGQARGSRPGVPPALVPARRGTPARHGPDPARHSARAAAVPLRARGSFAARQRGLARVCARVVRVVFWRGSPCLRRDA